MSESIAPHLTMPTPAFTHLTHLTRLTAGAPPLPLAA